MQVDIQAAVSVDGFIARENGDTDWVQDLELFEQTSREYGCIAMGRTTYDEFAGPAFDGVQHIVLSSKPQKSAHETVHFVQTVEQALAKAKELGFAKLLVIGGSQTNGSFMQAGVVNNLLLDIHPILLGKGKRLLEGFSKEAQLRLQSSTQNQAFLCTKYRLK